MVVVAEEVAEAHPLVVVEAKATSLLGRQSRQSQAEQAQVAPPRGAAEVTTVTTTCLAELPLRPVVIQGKLC